MLFFPSAEIYTIDIHLQGAAQKKGKIMNNKNELKLMFLFKNMTICNEKRPQAIFKN